MKRNGHKLSGTVAGVRVTIDCEVTKHAELGTLISAGDVRRFELEAVSKMIGRTVPLTGEQVRYIRRALGFDQEQFGELLDVGRQTILRYETSGDIPLASDYAIRFLASLHLTEEGTEPELDAVARKVRRPPHRAKRATPKAPKAANRRT